MTTVTTVAGPADPGADVSPESTPFEPHPVPSFLGIGAQKAGTTWLWENLRVHPQLFLPRRKELHWLDQHWDQGEAWYLQHFRPRRVRRRLPGEITPAYLVVPQERIEAVQRMSPNVRLILMVRHPVDRAWSAAKYFARNQMDREVADLPFDEFEAMVTTPLMLQRGDYLEGLRRWESVFAQEQLMVVFHDEVVADPEATLQRVLRHIGVEPGDLSDHPLATVFNAGPTSGMPDAHRTLLDGLFEDQIAGLARRFGDRSIPWLSGE